MQNSKMHSPQHNRIIVTAGSHYLDIDAYACSIAMSELLRLQGRDAVAYSDAPCNYSVCRSLQDDRLLTTLPAGFDPEAAEYIIVDVSDPLYIKDRVPIDSVIGVYDHHTGYEEFWHERIGDEAHIEFIGAAATLIFREWKDAGLLGRMTRQTALLLIAAILDNTLNLTSSNTAPPDIEAFETLCKMALVDTAWCASYFSEVQDSVEADLHNALFNDIKSMQAHPVLPPRFAQLCVWDAQRIIRRLDEIRRWFDAEDAGWMINIIDIKRRRSCFACEDAIRQQKLEKIFAIQFCDGVAITQKAYLRKEIIKLTDSLN